MKGLTETETGKGILTLMITSLKTMAQGPGEEDLLKVIQRWGHGTMVNDRILGKESQDVMINHHIHLIMGDGK